MDERRDLLLHRWVTGAFDTPESLCQALREARIPCDENQRYLVLVLRVDEYRRQLKRLGMDGMYRARQKLLQVSARAFAPAECVMGSEAYVVVVLIREGFISLLPLYAPVSSIREEMARDGLSLTVGIGTHAIAPQDVPESLRNAHIATRYRMVFGHGQDIAYESVSMRVGAAPPYPEAERAAVVDAFLEEDSAAFERYLLLFFSAVYTQSVKFGFSAVGHLLMEMYRAMPEQVRAECDFVGCYTALEECDHFEQQLRLVRDFGMAAMERKSRKGTQDRHKEQMDAVLAYIRGNYTNPDLSINAIAEHAGLSTNTVRRLFRESGLETPKDYIQQLRMEEACRLLRETNLTAKDISLRIGFTESRYFYAVFKKHTGKTAYEFRADLRQSERR